MASRVALSILTLGGSPGNRFNSLIGCGGWFSDNGEAETTSSAAILNESRPMNTPEPVDPNELQPGPIRHESLSPELLEQVEFIYENLGPYLETTLEQFEINFMRDADPESEVLIWTCIAAAWIDFHKEYLDDELLPEEAEKKIVAALILISTGVQDVHKLGVPVEMAQQLLACYDNLGKE
jgi:hypothetical protein